jgi:hypothetical protein
MAVPVTWSGLTSVTADSAIDSDIVALPPGTIGFSAIGSVLGGSPSGIGGNLQVAVSNTGTLGSFIALPGPLSVLVSTGLTDGFSFSYLNAFYNFALLRWVQAGAYDAGTLLGWNWSVSVSPTPPGPTPPGPAPSPVQTFAPTGFGQSPQTAGQIGAMLNALFANRWVQPPGQNP